jgi:CspA family cold shock protein
MSWTSPKARLANCPAEPPPRPPPGTHLASSRPATRAAAVVAAARRPSLREAIVKTGTIARLLADKGFGFVRGSDGQEYFFHRSGAGQGFIDLREGQSVVFEEESSPKGPRATHVRAAS